MAEKIVEDKAEYKRHWRKKNWDKVVAYAKKYQSDNKDALKDRYRAYRAKNKQKIFLQNKRYVTNNYEKHLKKRREYTTNRRGKDISFRVTGSLRSRMASALNGSVKSSNTFNLIGCDVFKLRHHIELLFTNGMCWENYGKNGWHIDHIRPCSSFDLTKEEEQRECFHYTNLQPLWALDNLKKRDKI